MDYIVLHRVYWDYTRFAGMFQAYVGFRATNGEPNGKDMQNDMETVIVGILLGCC